MPPIRSMLEAHPTPVADLNAATRCLIAALECSALCSSCADACLGEDDPDRLTACIRLNIDCAAVCTATAMVVSRPAKPGPQPLQAQLAACAAACRACAEECGRHATMHEHCRICADACLACEVACEDMMKAVRHAGDMS